MTHHRFYRNTVYTPEDTVAQLVKLSGLEFDPSVVSAFISAIYEIPPDALGKLMGRAGTSFDATPREVLLRGTIAFEPHDLQNALKQLDGKRELQNALKPLKLGNLQFRKAVSVMTDQAVWRLILDFDIVFDVNSVREFGEFINPQNRGRWASLQQTLEKESGRPDARQALEVYRTLHLENVPLEHNPLIH